MIDASGRNIDYLRVSVTDRCNLRCIYCMPEEGVPLLQHREILRLEEIEELVGLIHSVLDLRKIRITGGEPLVRRGVVSLVGKLSNLAETAMTTNGVLLPGCAAELASSGLSRVNISIDSLNDSVLRRITRREVTAAMIEDAVRSALENGLAPVKLNCVVLRGINTGELGRMVEWASSQGAVMRFIEHMPMEGSTCGYVSRNEILDELAGALGTLESSGRSGTAEMFTAESGQKFGLIAPVGSNMCEYCARVRLTADGRLLPCLSAGEPLMLGEMLRNGSSREEMKGAIRALTLSKPLAGSCGGVRMWRIGG